jgi:hypothetical protein
MLREGTTARRLVLTLLVLCLTLWAQSAALDAAGTETHGPSQHCCGLCHLGPIPVLPAAITTVVAPVSAPLWLAACDAAPVPHEVLLIAAATRAPPA